MIGQQAPLAMPPWLTPYPGANAETTASSPALTESQYSTDAKPAQVIAHYQKLFDAAGLHFTSNFDGAGTSMRAAATECDLLVKVREEGTGTVARISCAAKSAAPSGAEVVVTNGSGATANPRPLSEQAEQFRAELRRRREEAQARSEQLAANFAAGKSDESVWPHAPENDPPPLVWPTWLIHFRAGRPSPEAGVDQSRKKYLQSRFTSGAPMTEIYTFYKDLLNANGFGVHSASLETGHTIEGIVQNADGHVEGAHHPYDPLGPRTVIRVSFSRFHLNDPIDVRIKVTAYPRF
jgi:hypothetical protein